MKQSERHKVPISQFDANVFIDDCYSSMEERLKVRTVLLLGPGLMALLHVM